jgi:hypothetical protein
MGRYCGQTALRQMNADSRGYLAPLSEQLGPADVRQPGRYPAFIRVYLNAALNSLSCLSRRLGCG